MLYKFKQLIPPFGGKMNDEKNPEAPKVVLDELLGKLGVGKVPSTTPTLTLPPAPTVRHATDSSRDIGGYASPPPSSVTDGKKEENSAFDLKGFLFRFGVSSVFWLVVVGGMILYFDNKRVIAESSSQVAAPKGASRQIPIPPSR